MKSKRIIVIFFFLAFSIALCNAQDIEEYYREAVKFYLWGDFKQSLSELNRILEIEPNFEKGKILQEIVLRESLTIPARAGELSVEVGKVTTSETSAKEGVVPVEFLARRLLALESASEYTFGTDDVLEISVWELRNLQEK